MSDGGPTGKEWGIVLGKLDHFSTRIDKFDSVHSRFDRLDAELDSMKTTIASREKRFDRLERELELLKLTMHRGWGMVIGVVAVIGMFTGDVINGIKRLLGVS